MDQLLLDIAGAARFLLDSCDVTEPRVPILEMAQAWGFCVMEGYTSRNHAGVITYDATKPEAQQRFDVAHELGHVIANHVGLSPYCERTASLIAAATLCPDAAWKRDLGTYEWDLEALSDIYGVGYEVAARRALEVRGAVVSAWERGRLVGRWRSPWLRGRGFSRRRVPAWERALAEATHENSCPLVEGTVRSWWTPSRVWVVAPVEAWEAVAVA